MFQSGQKLTAGDLNNLASLANGQNIPTDSSYVKTPNGTLFTTPVVANPDTVKYPKIFDVCVRYHNINSEDPNDGEDPKYVPFWYVYLGTDIRSGFGTDTWDINIECGSGFKLQSPAFIFTKFFASKAKDYDSYAYRDVIVQQKQFSSDDNQIFSGVKLRDKESQVITSDNDGWYCTGVPALVKYSLTDTVFDDIDGNELYATFVRGITSTESQGCYDTVLIFSNNPIVSLSQINQQDDVMYLPNGEMLHLSEIMGGHSQKIGAYSRESSTDLYHITGTNMYPSDMLQKTNDNFQIITPYYNADFISEERNQIHRYRVYQINFIGTNGGVVEYVDNHTDHIIFENFEEKISPNADAAIYYMSLEVDTSYDNGELPPYELKFNYLKQINLMFTDMTSLRDNLNKIQPVINADIRERLKEEPTKQIKPIAAILVNANRQGDEEEGEEPDPKYYSIEYVAYFDRYPNFTKDCYYDSRILTDPYQFSLERRFAKLDIKDHEGKEYSIYGLQDELFQFHNKDYYLESLQNVSVDVVVREYVDDILGRKATMIDYVPLNIFLQGLSSLSGTHCSADTEVSPLNLSSIGVIKYDGEKVYELYNFDKMRTDINAHIMPVGSMLPGRFGKVGKLLDQNNNELTAVDIVARDKDTHEVKYLNFSVDETFADTDVGAAAQASLEFKQDATGMMTYAQLYDFQKCPADTLSATINNNGIVNITDDNTWMLTKTYNPINQRLELQYKHLALSVDLSAVSSDSISGDTNAIAIRKSIDTKQQGNVKYHQLHNFDNPNPTTKTVDMQAKNTAYDTLDSNEYFVIKSGDEVKYKKVQIKDNTPGGGTTSGYTGSVVGDCRLKWNTRGTYKIELWGKDMTYENGLLKTVGNERLVSELDTVGYSGQ